MENDAAPTATLPDFTPVPRKCDRSNGWKPEVQRAYNERIQARMADKVWLTVDKSWYRTKDKVTNNWVGRTTEYRRATRKANAEDYRFG